MTVVRGPADQKVPLATSTLTVIPVALPGALYAMRIDEYTPLMCSRPADKGVLLSPGAKKFRLIPIYFCEGVSRRRWSRNVTASRQLLFQSDRPLSQLSRLAKLSFFAWRMTTRCVFDLPSFLAGARFCSLSRSTLTRTSRSSGCRDHASLLPSYRTPFAPPRACLTALDCQSFLTRPRFSWPEPAST